MDYLWRPFDQHGDVLDVLVHRRRRNIKATKGFLDIGPGIYRSPLLWARRTNSSSRTVRFTHVEHRRSRYLHDRCGAECQPARPGEPYESLQIGPGARSFSSRTIRSTATFNSSVIVSRSGDRRAPRDRAFLTRVDVVDLAYRLIGLTLGLRPRSSCSSAGPELDGALWWPSDVCPGPPNPPPI